MNITSPELQKMAAERQAAEAANEAHLMGLLERAKHIHLRAAQAGVSIELLAAVIVAEAISAAAQK
jgi:hypothetical protein